MIRVESLDQEGRGVAHADGKVMFVEGALPGELVTMRRTQEADATRSRRSRRSSSPAPHARRRRAARISATAAAAAMQHVDARAQVAAKQRVLEDNLRHIGKGACGRAMLPAITGRPWGYRYRARLSVRDVQKKGGVLVGFHEKRKSSYVADMTSATWCRRGLSALLLPLRELIDALSMPRAAAADRGGDRRRTPTRLVLRILEPLERQTTRRCAAFADRHGVQFWSAAAGPPNGAVPFYPPHATRALLRAARIRRCKHAVSRRPISRRSTHAVNACWCGGR